MRSELLEILQHVSKEYRIDFVGELNPRQWPECHRMTFADTHELGKKAFDTDADSTEVLKQQPWKSELKHLARRLVESAERCRHRNESSWRMACEPLIFGRLSAEVVWQVFKATSLVASLRSFSQNCRKRLWRSEIEATRSESSAAEALSARQNAREPCRCPRIDRREDYLEATGLNRIFGHREDDSVYHEPELSAKLVQKTQSKKVQANTTQSPDAIYGLRMTRNIENLLYDTTNTEINDTLHSEPQQVHELLDPSPFKRPLKQIGDPLVFPFLILEAKSGMAMDDWHSIQMQTSLPIRAFLEAQNALRRAADKHSRWKTGPLVWFFANRGEDWRLSAAFLHNGQAKRQTTSNIDYRVVDLWRGSILSHDGALQLLLLVDYIFDWARDVYREDIIKELRVLASQDNDRASLVYTDTDIYSTRHVEATEHFGAEGGDGEFEAYQTAQGNFMALDSEKGVIRHANFIESRYCCVYVTRDNVQTLLQSIQQTRTQKLCSLVLAHMTESNILNQETLNAIEEQWTGYSRFSPASLITQTQFYTVISSTTYLSGNWHQVRELYIIAIAEDAWPALVHASKLKKGRGNAQTPSLATPFDAHTLLENIRRLKMGSPRNSLLAAIQRRAVKVKNRWDDSTVLITPDDGAFRDTVHYLYRFFKKGNLEPQEPFFRCSKRAEQQNSSQFDGEPFSRGQALQVSDQGCVLITSSCHSHDPERSKSTICAYFVDGRSTSPPDRKILAKKIRRTYAGHDVYHTTQDNGTSNITNISIKRKKGSFYSGVPWNLEDTYGMCGDFDFLYFILSLGGGLPSTQGTPRSSVDSGSYLHEKNYQPWHDARRIFDSEYKQRQLFTAYKLLTRELLYWRTQAEEQCNRGKSCCTCCAKLGKDDTCGDCFYALGEWNRPEWYVRAMRGETPIQHKAVGVEELLQRWPHSFRSEEEDVWKQYLEIYPDLNQPFKHIGELWEQWRVFEKWRNEKQEASWKTSFGKKRKRLSTESSDRRTDDTDSLTDSADELGR